MRSFLLFVVLSTVWASVVCASVNGGAYVVSNRAENSVLVFATFNNGSSTFRREVPTGGAGYEASNAAASDALGSQGALVTEGNNLFVVNAGSNTLTYFQINQRDPTLIAYVDQQSTNGVFPNSATAHHGVVCVLNGGSIATITCFSYDQTSGLTVLPGWGRNTGVASGSKPSQISFSPDGALLVVTVRGTSHTVMAFTVDWLTMSLSSTYSSLLPTNAVAPFGFSFGGVHSGERIVVITDPGNAPAGADVVAINTATGAISASSKFVPIAGAAAPCWSFHSDITNAEYTVNAGSQSLSEMVVQYQPLSLSNTRTATVSAGTVGTVEGPLLDAAVQRVSSVEDAAYVLAPGTGGAGQLLHVSVTRESLAFVDGASFPAAKSAQGVATYHL